jgi:hypothetical protein
VLTHFVAFSLSSSRLDFINSCGSCGELERGIEFAAALTFVSLLGWSLFTLSLAMNVQFLSQQITAISVLISAPAFFSSSMAQIDIMKTTGLYYTGNSLQCYAMVFFTISGSFVAVLVFIVFFFCLSCTARCLVSIECRNCCRKLLELCDPNYAEPPPVQSLTAILDLPEGSDKDCSICYQPFSADCEIAIAEPSAAIESSVELQEVPLVPAEEPQFNTEAKVEIVQVDQCSHIFHRHCIQRWLDIHNNCPLCRVQVVLQ